MRLSAKKILLSLHHQIISLHHRRLGRVEPVYAEFPGWNTPTHEITSWKKLPLKCRNYLKAIAELTGAKLSIASVGPGREQTMFL